MTLPAMAVGDRIRSAGIFAQASRVRGAPVSQVARRPRCRRDRPGQGRVLSFGLDKPLPKDFACMGCSDMSGGALEGHLTDPAEPRTAAERLRAGGDDLDRIERRPAREVSTLGGHRRLANAVPSRDPFGKGGRLQGVGMPQWKLKPLARKPFRVAAVVQPGERYMGNYH
jgi:hypothetical protein